MSSKDTPIDAKPKSKDSSRSDQKSEIQKKQSQANEEKVEPKGEPTASPPKPDPSESLSLSFSPNVYTPERTPDIQTLISGSDANTSEVTHESLKYLQILDQYVSGKHWDFDLEYLLNTISGVVWSLSITFFIFYDIDDKCWDELDMLLILSSMVSATSCLEMTIVCILWYLSFVYQLEKRSRISAVIIVLHIVIAISNLLLAIVQFGSRTCHQRGALDYSREKYIPVLYELRFIGAVHCIVSINLMFCAMFLAIKRNDFKFYVLWRKGLLNQYLMLDEE